ITTVVDKAARNGCRLARPDESSQIRADLYLVPSPDDRKVILDLSVFGRVDERRPIKTIHALVAPYGQTWEARKLGRSLVITLQAGEYGVICSDAFCGEYVTETRPADRQGIHDPGTEGAIPAECRALRS